ncbi:MAG: tyrosine-type recombinase/integrase [Planctomycetes bacterium]|nr:tyrosine-type recombinase/integrase [Planctomycetota bacterium]
MPRRSPLLPWSEERAWEGAHRLIELAPPRLRSILSSFLNWLRTIRAMQPESVRARVRPARDFLLWITHRRAPTESLGSLTPDRVERFFAQYGHKLALASLRSVRSSVRSFLEFTADHGLTQRRLVEAIPTVRTYRLAETVRGIGGEEIRLLLDSVDDDIPSGTRDRAVLLVLATYGIRRGQITSLRLGDIAWRDGQIRFRGHKDGKTVTQVLVGVVASALARYIREVRPAVDHDRVFTRLRRPYLPLGPAAVGRLVGRRVESAQIEPGRSGPHVFRHAFATRLLRSGRSLKEEADHLGHRHLASASIYAKVDQPSLREVAIGWPEVLR